MTAPAVPTPAPSKSCLNCPSFGHSQMDQHDIYGYGVGTPVCKTLGKLLTAPAKFESGGDEQLASLEEIASNCASYGLPPKRSAKFDNVVAKPHSSILAELSMRDGTQAIMQPKTCETCAFFTRPEQVEVEVGWRAGICGAFGKTVAMGQFSTMAQLCNSGQVGPQIYGMPELLDIYNPAYFNDKLEAMAHVNVLEAAAQPGFTDPLAHPTEKPVTAEDEARGVLSWRKVSDPDDAARFTFLPIYRPDFFTEDERAKIPQAGDDEHPELYIDHNNAVYLLTVAWMELDETPALVGPAGVGKTEVYRHMAFLMQIPFERFSFTGSTELDDLAGKMMYHPESGTYFHYGRLVKAWRRPAVLCLDEPNAANPEVWQFIRPLTDNSKQLVLDFNEGERVPRSDATYLGMAMNPAWDPLNTGVNNLADADSSRLLHVRMDLPPKAIEEKIIKDRCELDGFTPSDDQMKGLMRIAEDIRSQSKDGSLPLTWGIRNQIKVARMFKWFSPHAAYRAATDHLEPEVQELIMNSVTSVFTPPKKKMGSRPGSPNFTMESGEGWQLPNQGLRQQARRASRLS